MQGNLLEACLFGLCGSPLPALTCMESRPTFLYRLELGSSSLTAHLHSFPREQTRLGLQRAGAATLLWHIWFLGDVFYFSFPLTPRLELRHAACQLVLDGAISPQALLFMELSYALIHIQRVKFSRASRNFSLKNDTLTLKESGTAEDEAHLGPALTDM